jgi:hypothetical protein
VPISAGGEKRRPGGEKVFSARHATTPHHRVDGDSNQENERGGHVLSGRGDVEEVEPVGDDRLLGLSYYWCAL